MFFGAEIIAVSKTNHTVVRARLSTHSLGPWTLGVHCSVAVGVIHRHLVTAHARHLPRLHTLSTRGRLVSAAFAPVSTVPVVCVARSHGTRLNLSRQKLNESCGSPFLLANLCQHFGNTKRRLANYLVEVLIPRTLPTETASRS